MINWPEKGKSDYVCDQCNSPINKGDEYLNMPLLEKDIQFCQECLANICRRIDINYFLQTNVIKIKNNLKNAHPL